jgi:hypothetical protein
MFTGNGGRIGLGEAGTPGGVGTWRMGIAPVDTGALDVGVGDKGEGPGTVAVAGRGVAGATVLLISTPLGCCPTFIFAISSSMVRIDVLNSLSWLRVLEVCVSEIMGFEASVEFWEGRAYRGAGVAFRGVAGRGIVVVNEGFFGSLCTPTSGGVLGVETGVWGVAPAVGGVPLGAGTGTGWLGTGDGAELPADGGLAG